MPKKAKLPPTGFMKKPSPKPKNPKTSRPPDFKVGVNRSGRIKRAKRG